MEEDNKGFDLSLSLSSELSSPTQPPPRPLPIHLPPFAVPQQIVRLRSNSNKASEGKNPHVPAPFVWETTHRATVHRLEYLISKNIDKITGNVECKRCQGQFVVEYDLREKFIEVGSFICSMKNNMHHRAPKQWLNPQLLDCRICQQKQCAKPVISPKKKSINWLFLLLGQMLGCCTLGQLKYFCKHTNNHRTGAKDRVLYLTYLGLCKQLDPMGPFDP
ncbi:uncharacterized protein LOC143853876 [Tasmannia lanceolata]|uniref:uncharacterized protein LOC143853876 n=1 Tax=Tasmannia lanceolata TaxID=3420 RepID=UPI004063E3A8